MQETLSTVSPKSALAKAILYSAKRWTALTRDAEDGRIEINNSQPSGAALCRAGAQWLPIAGAHAGGERGSNVQP